MAKRILIVDDEAMITKSLKKLLAKEGFAPTIVSSGNEALDQIKTNDFDLLILDIRMPQMDGIETITAIRQYMAVEGKDPIPEIVITGYADENKYKCAVDLKVSAYIYKPFDTNEFLDTIKKVLEQNNK
ncbi:MAG: response regulator [Candidatus Omnitrophota bacterium]|nr:response regulator [Candidatus Omnitrophota bacterium]MBU1929228.1 response regulator [Candidatus Omnitrophota bacterium]MBU2034523.1 response regulator [Candidatus Omnitrophota bacterium]MBU2222241.1 response regulator [Candidatus Omnitrophota bacterium]MBU2257904.1 response regulator [Candidatus Omnitrophota bacterium]